MSCKKRTHVRVHIVRPEWDFMILLLKSFHRIWRMCTSSVHVGTPNPASLSSDHARIYPTHERLRKLHVSIFMFDFPSIFYVRHFWRRCVHACVVVIKMPLILTVCVSQKRLFLYYFSLPFLCVFRSLGHLMAKHRVTMGPLLLFGQHPVFLLVFYVLFISSSRPIAFSIYHSPFYLHVCSKISDWKSCWINRLPELRPSFDSYLNTVHSKGR